jgi:7-cyano-7-deazaguanine synthase
MSLSSALVLLSGGQDSTTCLAWALSKFSSVKAVGFSYGQRHLIELEQAKKIAQLATVSFQIISLDFFSSLTPNALTHALPITHNTTELPSTFVPGRNIFFISTAAVIARQHHIKHIITGVCETDYSGYPDCRQQFIHSLQETLSLGLDYPLIIHTPLMDLSKAETVKMMYRLGKLKWYAYSHTCYEGKRPACGRCPACILRLKGFKDAGYKDPLDYE